MAVIAPQSDVFLLDVPLEINDLNQLTFANASKQFQYFNSLPKKEVHDFTYQRKDGTIRYGANFDSLIKYNYVMYRNDAYSNKWFYAYIDHMEYLNDNVTAISISTDVWQTWQFDLNFKRTFVEREHVNDDTIGNNTIDEGLEVGDYVINSSQTLMPSSTVTDYDGDNINAAYPIMFQVSELATGFSIPSSMFNASYNRIFSGLYYFAVSTPSDARDVIRRYDNAGKGDAIIAIFLVPGKLLQGAKKFGELGYNMYIPQDNGHVTTLLNSTSITRPSTLNGYSPKNNKMFVYPFSYVYVTNNTGIDTTFRYEDFASNTPKFMMAGAIGQGCTVKLCPVSYKKYTNDTEVFEYGVMGAKYPVCAWSSDYYTNWVTQNAVNMAVSAGSGILSAGISASYGNYAGTASSLLSTVGGIMAQHYQAQVHPDQAKGNLNGSDILPGWERYYTVDCMSLRYEVARSIDEFFSMFGYKVNRVKVPNRTGRRNWNYVKTVGCYIKADIPQEDLEQIKSMFDKGITLWHNPATFADYSQNNDIV